MNEFVSRPYSFIFSFLSVPPILKLFSIFELGNTSQLLLPLVGHGNGMLWFGHHFN